MLKRIIVDLDAGTDDAFALMLLLFADDIEIVAITCVHGNTSVSNVYKNVQRILKLCKKEDIPVYIGATEPLITLDNFLKLNFHGQDGFGDLQYESDDLTIKNCDYNRKKLSDAPCVTSTREFEGNCGQNAIVMLNKIVTENPGDISLICLGPLTNLALTIKIYSEFVKDLKEIFLMGGNYKGVGNVTSAAEFNFHSDPEAAYITLHYSKCPITILPWEPCLDSTITFDWRYLILGSLNHPMMALLNAAEQRIYADDEKYWMPCDALLVTVFLNPIIAKQTFECNASVELQGLKTRAQVVINHTKELKPNVSIVTEIDYDLFKTMLIKSFTFNLKNH